MSRFFYAFALFQIPIGVLIDRFGSRVLLHSSSRVVHRPWNASTLGTLLIVFLRLLFMKLSVAIEWRGALLSDEAGGLIFACIFFFEFFIQR